MSQQPPANESLVLSYLGLRKAIGIIGILLPFVLVFGKILLERGLGIESSISAYYYTVMGDVFVGSLCAVGVFLLSYRGYERKDNIAGDIACIFAIGVALFPTKPEINWTIEGPDHRRRAPLLCDGLFPDAGVLLALPVSQDQPGQAADSHEGVEEPRLRCMRVYHSCLPGSCRGRVLCVRRPTHREARSDILARSHRDRSVRRVVVYQGRGDPEG